MTTVGPTHIALAAELIKRGMALWQIGQKLKLTRRQKFDLASGVVEHRAHRVRTKACGEHLGDLAAYHPGGWR